MNEITVNDKLIVKGHSYINLDNGTTIVMPANDDNLTIRESNEIKGDDNMNQVLRLYELKKIEEIKNKYNEKVEDDYNNIEVVKSYKKLVEEFEENMESLFKSIENFDNDYLVERYNTTLYKYGINEVNIKFEILKKYKEDNEKELAELHQLIDEVNAQLSMSDDLDYQVEVLTRYGILDKKTKKLAD